MKIIPVIVLLMLAFFCGCENEDGRLNGYASYTFINDTGNADGSNAAEINVLQNGGTAWLERDYFVLQRQGEEQSIELTDPEGTMEYRWQTYESGVKAYEDENIIIFRRN